MIVVGAPVGGLLADAIGYRPMLWIATAGFALVTVALAASPFRHHDTETTQPSGALVIAPRPYRDLGHIRQGGIVVCASVGRQETHRMTAQPHQHGYIHRKDDYLRRLRRIEGQARGLQRMVDEEKYCIDILTQVSAMTKALQSVALGLLEEHMSHCVVDAAAAGGREAEEKVKEATDAIARLVRS